MIKEVSEGLKTHNKIILLDFLISDFLRFRLVWKRQENHPNQKEVSGLEYTHIKIDK